MIRPAIISVLFLSPVAFATGDFVLPQSVQSSSPAAYDVFGSDIAMHAGSLMFVGVRGADAQGANAGAVEIFQRSAGAWSFLERPIATGLAAGDQLGESVAGNASWIIAGASRHDASGADAGAAWVFKKGASNWAFAQKLVPSAGSAGAHFGASVALSTNAMAVGAPTAASGGAVMTFRIVSNAWAPFTTIANPSPMSGDRFGDALAMTDSWLAIGDPFDDTRGTDAGAVHIYVKTPLNWGYSTTLLPVSTAAGQHFGQSVSISGTRLAVGAYGADTGAYESGRADVFDLLSSVWTRTASLTPSYAAFSGNFGWDVSLDSGTLAVGVPGGGAVALAGEVELFTRQSDATWLPVAIGGLAGAEAQDVLGASVATSAGQLVAAAPAAHPSNGYRGRLGAVDLSVDCDGNTIPDIFDLANGAPDCDGDGVQDACEVNSDGDALPNDCDGCPNDPNKTSAGACGCGVADTDSDSDGTPNCNDLCPNDPAKTSPGTCGCGVADTDSDSDGTPNCNDLCPSDPAKTSPGTCGCGVADTDSDSDGTPNCVDTCPNDPTNQCDLVFEVPTEYATIQAAIDAAPTDRASVVLVAAGTFNESFDLRSKDIVVRGQLNGLTILRGVGLTTSIAKFSGGEPATAGVENLVFRDGTVGSRITPTTAYTVGGAIYGTNSFAFIRHCRFEGCRADYGGAVYLLYGGVTIDGCEFVGNIANIEGGGVQCFSCTGMVRGSVFNLNRCGMNGPGSGSALKFVGANATGDAIFVDDCSFTGNIAGVSGSAIEFYENVQGYPGVLHISRTNCANNVSGSPAQTGAAGLRVLGRMESCRLSEGSIFCANLPRNVSGPYFDDGTAGVCDCAADFNADGNVNASDLSLLLSVWGATLTSGVGDVTHNGTVDAGDLAVLLSLWGACDSN